MISIVSVSLDLLFPIKYEMNLMTIIVPFVHTEKVIYISVINCATQKYHDLFNYKT